MLSLLCTALLASSPAAASPLLAAVERVAAAMPSETWSNDRGIVGDFTVDGIPDVALLGAAADRVTVAVVVGPISSRSQVLSLRFAAAPDSQGGICGSPREARIESEAPAVVEDCAAEDEACESELSKRARAAARRGGRGIALVNEECDRFHIVFDGTRLVWTRR